MSVKKKKHIFGYDLFEKDIPFKIDKDDYELNVSDDFKLNHNWSFLKMNDD